MALCHILCEMITATFQTEKKSLRYVQQASRWAETFTGHFFNEKEAKLVCLVLPAGCHYGPLESSLRESAGLIVPKVPRTASWGAWLPLSAFTAQMCLGDRFPRQRHQRATYFFSVLCRKRQARRGIRECICLDLSEQLGRSSHFALILFEALPYKS